MTDPATPPTKYCGADADHGPHPWGSDRDYTCPGKGE